MAAPWYRKEVERVVADYFDMLSKELSGVEYRKSEHRRNLMPLLENRSEGSIEFKHQNISAVLIHFGQPYIKGYLPRFNYQKLLEEVVFNYLVSYPSIEKLFEQFSKEVVSFPSLPVDFNQRIMDPPVIKSTVKEPTLTYTRSPIRTNYLEKEQQNRKLGLLGEEWVMEYEKWHLTVSGRENLADRVEWVSREQGDGAGFDILSHHPNGSDKYIEVKTTRLGKETPFFFSRNELLFSKDHSRDYHLYRLFHFDDNARMFIKTGGLDAICTSFPVTFKGYF